MEREENRARLCVCTGRRERNWSRRAAASATASANLNPNVLKVICDAEGTKALKTHSLSDRAALKTHWITRDPTEDPETNATLQRKLETSP